ncbi:MAG: hypothetical protein JW788_03335 [Candidatus Omnitrophica bacterium]|nr:hypothetical protein [Candidatus Omnitrophota bacterium]
MNKRLILTLALALVVGISLTAYAEVQNVKVSGDLTVEALTRNNIMLRKDNQAPNLATAAEFNQFDDTITGLLSHVRVRVDADLTDNVSTTVRLLTERAWGVEGAADTDLDLDLAFVTLKEFLYSPLTLTVGRQELMYGNGLVIGDPDTNGICAGHGATALSSAGAAGSATATGAVLPRSLDDLSSRKSFDAVKAVLNYDPLVVDLVYAKVNEGNIDQIDDTNLYGINANYMLNDNVTLEGYYWEKVIQKAGAALDATGAGGGLNPANAAPAVYTSTSHDDVVRTLGTRMQYTGVKNLVLSLEGAYQFGTKVNNATLYPDDAVDAANALVVDGGLSSAGGVKKRQAFAIQVLSQYSLADLIQNYEPVVNFNYTFLSGERYRNIEETHRGWDAMYENQSSGKLYNKILGNSNCQLFGIGTSLKPAEDIVLSLDFAHLMLVRAYSSEEISTAGAPYGVTLTGVLGDPTYTMEVGKNSLANEIDAALTYNYTEDVQFGLAAGWFLPSSAFSEENDKDATQVIGSMKVTF